MYPPNPQQPQNPQWQPGQQPSNPGWPPQNPQYPGQPPNPQQPMPPPQYGGQPMPPYQGQPMPPGYPPQYPGQMPPMMPPPKRKMPAWQKILIGVAVGFVALCALVNGLNRAAQPPTNQPTATVASQSTQAQPTPTPTPIPEKTLFSKEGQTASLAFNNSEIIDISEGKIKMSYGCLRDLKEGVDVQLTILAVDADGFPSDTLWATQLECPRQGSDELNVKQGKYKVTVATSGDPGWSLKITQ